MNKKDIAKIQRQVDEFREMLHVPKIYGSPVHRHYEDDSSVTRNIGDVWYTTNPVTGITYRWEQKKGYRIKSPANMYNVLEEVNNRKNKFFNCTKEVCTASGTSYLDNVFATKTGRCEECQLEYETMLKIKGKYKEYEKNKLVENIKNWINDAYHDVCAFKDMLKKTEYVGDNGQIEKWSLDNVEERLKSIDEAFKNLIYNLCKKYDIDSKLFDKYLEQDT